MRQKVMKAMRRKFAPQVLRFCMAIASIRGWIVCARLTLAFGIDTALGFGFELGLDIVEQLVEALSWARLGRHDSPGRVVVHAGGGVALPGEGAKMEWRFASRRALLRREQQGAVCDDVGWKPGGRKAVVAQLARAIWTGTRLRGRPSGGRDGCRMDKRWMGADRDANG